MPLLQGGQVGVRGEGGRSVWDQLPGGRGERAGAADMSSAGACRAAHLLQPPPLMQSVSPAQEGTVHPRSLITAPCRTLLTPTA